MHRVNHESRERGKRHVRTAASARSRKRAGLSLRSLAERVHPKVTAQAISKYEAGKMMPSSAVLVGLGAALDVSLDFLMSNRIDVLDGLEFRKDPGTSARDRARAEAVLIDELERYLTIEDILGIPPAGDRFAHCRCDCIATEAEIDGRADQLREEWDLGMDPVPSLCGLLEEKGIKVVEADLPERISGLARAGPCDRARSSPMRSWYRSGRTWSASASPWPTNSRTRSSAPPGTPPSGWKRP